MFEPLIQFVLYFFFQGRKQKDITHCPLILSSTVTWMIKSETRRASKEVGQPSQAIKHTISPPSTHSNAMSYQPTLKTPSLGSCLRMESIRTLPKAFRNRTLSDLCRFTPLIHVSAQPTIQDKNTVVPSCCSFRQEISLAGNKLS